MRLRSPTLLLLAALAIALALVLRGMGLGNASVQGVALAAERQPNPEVGIPAAQDLTPAGELRARPESPKSELSIAAPSRSFAAPAPAAATGPQARVELQVVSAASGAGLADVRVVVFLEERPGDRVVPDRPGDGNRGTLGSSALTDAQGFVYLAVPANAALRLSLVDQAGAGAHASSPLPALEPDQLQRLRLPFERGGDRFFLSVTGSDDGDPIPNASASFAERRTPAPQAPQAPHTMVAAIKASPAGLLSLRLTRDRSDWLWVSAPMFAPSRIRIGPGHDSARAARRISLTRSASLHLQLLDANGAPAAQVGVTISTAASNLGPTAADTRGCVPARWTATTDAQGWANFEGLVPDAPLAIEVESSDERSWPAPTALVLSPEEQRKVVLRRKLGTRLEGRLIPHGNTTVAGLELWLLPADRAADRLLLPAMGARAFARAVTDQAGRYHFLDVPAGTWWLGPAPGRESQADAARPAPRATWMRVPEDCERLHLDLDVHPALWLTGRVLTAKGFSAGRQRLWAKPVMGGDGLSAWTDSKGRFRVGPVPAGTYEIAVDAAFAHTGSSPLVLDADAAPVEIQLRAGASIIGLAFDPKGGELLPMSVLVTRSDGQVTQADSLDIDGLPDGTHGLFMRSAAGRVGFLASLVANAGHRPSEVLLTLEEAAELRVHQVGEYRLWLGGVCVGMGEASPGTPLLILAPAGSARLERIGKPQRTPLQLVAGQTLEFGR